MIDIRKTTIQYLLPTFCGLLLSACGGGGGSDAPTTTTTPTAKACLPVTSPGDPLYSDQWHLKNNGTPTGTAGEDVNVESVWSTLCGLGITIAVVDTGIEIAHEDLAANVVAGGSFNYTNQSTDPTPPGDEAHGTSVAGVAAAVGFNGIGVRGAAHGAQLVGYNLLMNLTTINEADAMVRGKTSVDISNNSWSNQSDDGLLVPENAPWRASIDEGITTGRGGKGINYFWAGGNGRGAGDNSNYDGQASYHGVNAVAALDDNGKQTSYSESGANILISAHVGELCDDPTPTANATTTVDLSGTSGANNNGKNGTDTDYADDNYTQCFNGTSSATPLVSGVAALVLQANPNLTRRDMRLLLAKTARRNDPADADWTVNKAGLNINHKYGYGAVNAAAAVAAAASWPLLSAEKMPEMHSSGPIAVAIADSPGPEGTFAAAATNAIAVDSSSISQLEFVDVTVASDHPYWSDLEIVLTSPSGTKSVLTSHHASAKCFDIAAGTDGSCEGMKALSAGWRFGSVRHFDEAPVGDWQISVRDAGPGDTGNITSWSIKLYGR